jgi:hypothetical protein
MPRVSSRQLERIQGSLDALYQRRFELDQAQAWSRCESGERRWSDFKLLGSPLVARWRGALLASMPLALSVRRTMTSEPSSAPAGRTADWAWPAMSELVAHVPDEPLSQRCVDLLASCQRDWRSPELDVSIQWARIRLTLGRTQGAAIRRVAWEPFNEGWRPSPAAINAVARYGNRDDQESLKRLIGPGTFQDGRVYTLRGVHAGGEIWVWGPGEEAKTGH